ncbi:phosphate signaling complex protein PhoU [Nocardioides sp. NPDC057772]|uniref:phosphate signaling complex protein PhoU n=1 Tax=Nocardioides sp. NPDC057772 TaxID=3346245 RepID=UPI00366BA07B
MRNRFHEDLETVAGQVGELFGLVERAIARSSRALLDADRELAEAVISEDLRIDLLCRQIEAEAIEIQMRQQPVARDLRLLLGVHRIVADLERSGDLAKNIAKQARRRHPSAVVPSTCRETVASMAQTAQSLWRHAHQVFDEEDVETARGLDAEDDQMDSLHRSLLLAVIEGAGASEVETAIDLTLIGRFYERIADHAVAIAHQVVYISTGEVVG